MREPVSGRATTGHTTEHSHCCWVAHCQFRTEVRMTQLGSLHTIESMPHLCFDVVTLVADGLQVAANGNATTTFADLGLAPNEPLVLLAREIHLKGAPHDRVISLVTDRLVCTNPSALQFVNPGARTSPASSVDIWAQRIDGALMIRSQGRKGAKGAQGSTGSKAEFKMVKVVINAPGDQEPGDGPVVKPTIITEPELTKAAGPGGQGKTGQQGESGPSISIRYVDAAVGPTAQSLGGDGGDGGDPGKGGSGGQHFPDGPVGTPGVQGPAGVAGTVTIERLASAPVLWQRYLDRSPGLSQSRAAHDLRVAEFHYRRGTPEALDTAQGLLDVLAARPGGYGAAEQRRARVLLQQLFEHTTFLGLPRDLDVTPDVAFAGQDNVALVNTALHIIGAAHSLASKQALQEDLADEMNTASKQTANTLDAADKRMQQADFHLGASMTATDIARGRITNLDKTIEDIRKAIEDEQNDGPGFLAVAFKIVQMGAAVAGAVAGIATGVGAVVAVGAGVAVLKGTADAAVDTWDMVEDIKAKLEDPALKDFINGIDDLEKTGKSLINLGKVTDELLKMGASHPADKIRELARLQRERILLLSEVGMHQQMEQEAQLGKAAATSEKLAIVQNGALSAQLAIDLAKRAANTDVALASFLTSVRQLLDMLSVRLFHTQRAREIYRGDDPVTPVRHDHGHLHPDLERALKPAARVSKIDQQLRNFTPEVIAWSSLVDEFAAAGNLSQTPVPFSFTTEDATFLASLHHPTTPELGFLVDIADIAEESGSQIFEARFDRVIVRLVGARISGTATVDSIKLSQFGRWSMRRRPDPKNPGGLVKTFALPERMLLLTARQVGDTVEASFESSVNPDAVPPDTIWGRGIAGNWKLTSDDSIDFSQVSSVEVAFITRALAGQGFRTRAGSQRLLTPLPGWPPAPVAPRGPTPIPPRNNRATNYAGAVAAVGAGLL
jgi:hypothetical protein